MNRRAVVLSFFVTGFCTVPALAAGSLGSLEHSLATLSGRLAGVNDAASCRETLSRWQTEVVAFTPQELREAATAVTPTALLQNLFGLRQRVRTELRLLSEQPSFVGADADACVALTREALASLRDLEDRTALDQRRSTGTAAPTSLRGASPWLLARGPVRLRSGDVLMSRGNAFVSAAIARIGTEEGQFSHLSQVYIDAPAGTEIAIEDAATDPRVYTIEAHIEVGSFTRPFRDYVSDANARVVQLRPLESAADAHAAASAIFRKVRSYQHASMLAAHRTTPNVNDNPPYDFKMNLADSSEIFCAEIVSLAQAAVGHDVPRFRSRLRKNDVTQSLGITVEETFAPSDLDVDPNFELLAEWRDLDKLPDILAKDSVFRAIYRWMETDGVRFRASSTDQSKAYFAWSVRHADAGFLDRLPKNMSPTMIAMTFVIDRVGPVLEQQVTTFEKNFGETHAGLRPASSAQDADLDVFRKEDILRFNAGRGSLFQWDLR